MAFCTACCVCLASIIVAALNVLFALAILTYFRAMADRVDYPGAEDPLPCGLPCDAEDHNATVGLPSESRVLLALITFAFLLLVLRAS